MGFNYNNCEVLLQILLNVSKICLNLYYLLCKISGAWAQEGLDSFKKSEYNMWESALASVLHRGPL